MVQILKMSIFVSESIKSVSSYSSLSKSYMMPFRKHQQISANLRPTNQRQNVQRAQSEVIQRVYRYTCSLCNKYIANLPRHLREFHKFDWSASLKYSRQQRRQDKQQIDSNLNCTHADCDKVSRGCFDQQQCPVKDCFSVIKRIDKHLQGSKHKFKISDPIYKQYVNLCKYDKAASRSSSCSRPPNGNVHQQEDRNLAKNAENQGPTHESSMSTNTSTRISDQFFNEITSFGRWLQTFGGGDKNGCQAGQVVKHVETVIAVYGQDFSTEVVTEKLQEVEMKFISSFLKSKTASTVKNYLLDFKKFIEYGKLLCKDWITLDTAERIVKQIQIWNRSLQKKILQRSAIKKLEHGIAVVTTDHIKLYLRGKRAILGNKILRDIFKDKKEDNICGDTYECPYKNRRNCYIRARNYIIMLFGLNNATRSGPLINLKVGEVDAACENVHANRHVVKVIQHKTMSLYGAAQLSLNCYHFKLLKSFIDHIRPLIPSFNMKTHSHATSNVFLSWSGRALNQSEISNIISNEFSVGANKKLRTSCTILRKSVVSIILELHLGSTNERDLASLMKHSDTMQKRTYDVRSSDRNMARMSNLVWKIMTKRHVSRGDLSRPKWKKVKPVRGGKRAR